MDWHPSDSKERFLGEWDDMDCTSLRPWACSMPVKSNLPNLELENVNDCPKGDGWLSWGVSCYYFNPEKMLYNEARDFCNSKSKETKNGQVFLASVLNEYENDFILSFFGSDRLDRTPSENIWIGLEVSHPRY